MVSSLFSRDDRHLNNDLHPIFVVAEVTSDEKDISMEDFLQSCRLRVNCGPQSKADGARAFVSVSTISLNNSLLVRFAADCEESAYHLLSELLRPMQEHIGYIPYSDKIYTPRRHFAHCSNEKQESISVILPSKSTENLASFSKRRPSRIFTDEILYSNKMYDSTVAHENPVSSANEDMLSPNCVSSEIDIDRVGFNGAGIGISNGIVLMKRNRSNEDISLLKDVSGLKFQKALNVIETASCL